jgi:hypothetical protein
MPDGLVAAEVASITPSRVIGPYSRCPMAGHFRGLAATCPASSAAFAKCFSLWSFRRRTTQRKFLTSELPLDNVGGSTVSNSTL